MVHGKMWERMTLLQAIMVVVYPIQTRCRYAITAIPTRSILWMVRM